jgi:putative colanic acid biosynthesis acetyltransferase WcaF
VVAEAVLFSTFFPGSSWRRALLRFFGAQVGRGVIIKPRVRVKFPWRFIIGANSWIGEGVWIDNLAEVRIGSNSCLSQGAYICTGNHDYKDELFRLTSQPITIEDECWICAFAKIAPGVTVKRGSVIGFGAVLIKDTEENKVYLGNPAVCTGSRK